jgi:putative endonuclease
MADESLRIPSWWRRWFGTRSERAAARYLLQRGWTILARNVAMRVGELDLVALDGEFVVFVEVRSTGTGDVVRPADSIDAAKQRRVSAAALAFLQKHRLLDRAARFDVLTVSWPPNQSTPVIVHFPNAFEAPDRFQLFS